MSVCQKRCRPQRKRLFLKTWRSEVNLLNCAFFQITSSAASDLNIKGDGKAIIRGNEGVNIMGRTVEFKMGGGIELRAVSAQRRTKGFCLQRKLRKTVFQPS